MRKLLLLFIFILIQTITFAQESVQLRWNPSTDNVGVTGYNLWLDGEYYGTTSDTTFILSLEIGLHVVAVSAFDAAGNESEKSETLMIDIKDIISPTTPENLMFAYPNPTYGGFTIAFGQEIKDHTILQVLTTNGQLVYHKQIPPNPPLYKEKFELEEILKPGLYVVALIENDVRQGYILLTVISASKDRKIYALNNN